MTKQTAGKIDTDSFIINNVDEHIFVKLFWAKRIAELVSSVVTVPQNFMIELVIFYNIFVMLL